MEMTMERWGAVAAVGVLLLIPLALRRAKPLPYSPHEVVTPQQEARARRDNNIRGGLAFLVALVMLALMGYVVWQALAGLYAWRLPAAEGGYVITLPDDLWGILALILALSSFPLATKYCYARMVGERWYTEWLCGREMKKYLYNPATLGRYTMWALLPTTLAAAFLALDCYASAGPQGMVVNGFWSMGEQHYAYGDIERVELVMSHKAPNGNVIRKPHYHVVFRNGERYNFDNHIQSMPLAREKEIADYIARQASLHPVAVEPFPR